MSDSERLFWAKVAKGVGCWEWKGARRGVGYGHLSRGGENIYAHRYSYELAHGTLGPDAFVCHRCDNRLCVRPDRQTALAEAFGVRQAVISSVVNRAKWRHVP